MQSSDNMAERETSLEQLASIRFRQPSITIRTLSADKAYGATEYLEALFLHPDYSCK
ncbi:hypothetical protein QT235_16570 [Geobacillus stearothermophilus]|nr:hypothetical protein IMZ17_15855 [Geobacillus stearothermophilus]WJQ09009.1 hypothetical protein QT235_16570 [Geobacillus stearothermophilus]